MARLEVRRGTIGCCGVALLGWSLLLLAEAPGSDLRRYVALTLGAWVIYVVALRLTFALPFNGLATRNMRSDLLAIFLVALAVRIALVASPPSLSDDIYRAVWDARLVSHGINPYAYAPLAPELQPLRDELIWPRVNHPEQRTPYPPLAEIAGALAYKAHPESVRSMQALAGTLDLLAALLLAALLARLGSDPRRCIVVAWSPIGAAQFAHSGHNDAEMVAALIAVPLLLTSGKRSLAAAALAAATMVKLVPVVGLPLTCRTVAARGLVVFVGFCAMVTLPFLGAGQGLVSGVLSEG